LANGSGAAHHYVNPGSTQRLMRIGTAIAGQHAFHTVLGQQARGLNPRTLPEGLVRVVERFEAQTVRLHKQEERAAAETRIHRRVELRLHSRHCNSHDFLIPASGAGTLCRARRPPL
jgi:hypothetical protein